VTEIAAAWASDALRRRSAVMAALQEQAWCPQRPAGPRGLERHPIAASLGS
jgi:hypothetical protein